MYHSPPASSRVTRSMAQSNAQREVQDGPDTDSDGTHTWSAPTGASALPGSSSALSSRQTARDKAAYNQSVGNGQEVGPGLPVPSNLDVCLDNVSQDRAIFTTRSVGNRSSAGSEKRRLEATLALQRLTLQRRQEEEALARTELELVNLEAAENTADESGSDTLRPQRQPIMRRRIHVEQWVHTQTAPVSESVETPLDTEVPRGERGARLGDMSMKRNFMNEMYKFGSRNIGPNDKSKQNEFSRQHAFTDREPNPRQDGSSRPPRQDGPHAYRHTTPTTNLSDMDRIEVLAQSIAKAFKGTKPDRPTAPSKFLHELPYFDGDVSEWVGFAAVYRDTCELFTDTQNVARLRKALRGPARETVRALINTAQNPLQILQVLERRFGRPEHIVLSELDKIKRMPKLAEDGRNISEFASRVANTVSIIYSVGQKRYINSPELIKQIEDKLSLVMRFGWFSYLRDQGLEPDLEVMSDYLNDLAERYSAMTPPPDTRESKVKYRDEKINKKRFIPRRLVNTASRYKYDQDSSQSDDESSDNEYVPRRTIAAAKVTRHAPTYSESEDDSRIPMRSASARTESDDTQSDTDSEYERFRVFAAVQAKDTTCWLCKKNHYLKDCELFTKKSTAERWEVARESRSCFRCLSGTHRRDVCKAKACGKSGCKKQHHKLLHYSNDEEFKPAPKQHTAHKQSATKTPTTNSTTNESKIRQAHVASVNTLDHERHAYLKIIPVELHGPKGKIDTYALLDEGSTMTLIEQETALAIAPPGKAEELRIEGVGGKKIDEADSYKLKLKIRGQFTRNINTMHAQTISKLNLPPQEVSRELISQCTHLADVQDEITYTRAKPTLLIGQDNWHLIVTRELKSEKHTQPVASLTRLGWVLHGFSPGPIKPVAFINYITPAAKQNSNDDLIKDHFSLDSPGIERKRPQSESKTFKPVVAPRLAEMKKGTRPTERRLVPTKDDVADDATRNVPTTSNASHRWYKEPNSLTSDPTCWPIIDKLDMSLCKQSPLPITGEEKISRTHTLRDRPHTCLPEARRFSSWTKLLRTTARVLQATLKFKALANKRQTEAALMLKKLVRKPKKATDVRPTLPLKQMACPPIEHELIDKAERLLIKQIQRDCFSSEIKRLKKGEPIERNSRLKNLCMTVDEEDILRIDGRLEAASNVINTYKRPAVIDANHYITKLIIYHTHCEFNHGNHETVMNELRQKYYVLALRRTVRKIVHSCQWCLVYRKKPQMAPQGNLPKERLTRNQPPFTCTAVDYFGPMTVTIGRRHEKRWGALFTCLTTRAVHLELAASLTTSSMIMALRRFIARRGKPTVIYSDNGTNFVGADRELAAIWNDCNEGLQRDVENRQIQWKFIPPGAPNMGGSWERLVKSVKVALAVTLKDRSPREEVLHTLLLEAEHTVNSRPLTPVSLETSEEALTPNHFLIGRSCGSTLFGSFNEDDIGNESTWRASQRLADHFWARWTREYLPTLLPRQNNKTQRYQNPAPGDIVLIVDSTMPRNSWPRGEVITVLPGQDGRVRVVEVRTAAGIVRRPASRLVIISNIDDSSPLID